MVFPLPGFFMKGYTDIGMNKFNGYKLDLDNIKLIVLDYDDTLCIHIHNGVTRPSEQDWDNLTKEAKENTYLDLVPCVPNKALKLFLDTYFEKTEKHLLTWANTKRLIPARKAFIKKYYDTEYFTKYEIAHTREAKLKYLLAVAEYRDLDKNEILLIEDHPSTLDEARDAGFMAISTAEITYMMWEDR